MIGHMKTRNLNPLISCFGFMVWFLFSAVFIACEDEKEADPEIQTGTMTDIDGNVYKTVYINGKWWMAENLNVKTYRDGTPIQNLVDDNDWNSAQDGYAVHPGASSTEMGLLYNWAAVSNPAGLAPSGWHIATDDEWKQLEASLGMESSAVNKTGWRGSTEGDALKQTGITNWYRNDPVWATNSSGFSALAGSCRLYNGQFGDPGVRYTGFWWTSTTSNNDTSKAWYRYLDYKSSAVFRQYVSKQYGLSVRCVKD